MRASLSFVTALAASSLAAPNTPVIVRDVTTTEVTEALNFALNAAACDVGDCVVVVGAAVCIIAGIAARSVKAVTECVTGGAGSLCPCANCVNGLGDFLQNNGLCPALALARDGVGFKGKCPSANAERRDASPVGAVATSVPSCAVGKGYA